MTITGLFTISSRLDGFAKVQFRCCAAFFVTAIRLGGPHSTELRLTAYKEVRALNLGLFTLPSR